jgi:hypothetical protein
MANKKISELPYINVSKISGNTLVPLVTYFSAATGDTVHTYISDLQTYLISGLTGNTDVFVTGGTYSAGTITITNNTGGTFNITGVTFSGGSSVVGDYLPLSGGTVSGGTQFTAGLTANTISATTYLNLPINTDVFVTGGTYSSGDATFTNNTGGTFNVTGFYTGQTSYVNSLTTGVGLSADTTTGNITIINTDPDQTVTISGGTGITTGGTYPNFTITNSAPDQTVTLSEGTNISVTGTYPNFTLDVTGLTDNDVFITGFTYDDNNKFTISKNSGSSLNATINLVSGLTVNGNLSVTGDTNINNLSATTISATTYQNLPLSATTYVSGGTYSAGTITFTNTSGGTFEVTGLTTGDTTTITGATSVGTGLTIFDSVVNRNIQINSITADTTEKVTTTLNSNTIELGVNEQNFTLWDLVVQGNRLLSGNVSYVSGLTFSVSPLEYLINGTIYEITSATTVTLNSGDTLYDRIDVIFADISGNTGVLEGTPSENPEKPIVDGDSQVEVTFVLVPANSTTPDINEFIIYNENAGPPSEWTFGVGGSQSTRISGNSTDDAYSGTTSIKVSGITAASYNTYFRLTGDTVLDTNNYATLQFAMKNLSANTTTSRIRLRFLTTGGTQNGNAVFMNAAGSAGYVQYSRTNVSTWQLISIPLWRFYLTNTNTQVLEVAFYPLGSPLGQNYYFDLFEFVEGTSSSPPSNSWTTIKGDSATTIIAPNPNATLTISGGTNISSSISGTSTVVLNLDNNINLNGVTASTISATTYQNLPSSTFTGGTVNGSTNFTNGLTANTISATTYQNLPISGLTEGNNINISGSNGNYTISVTGSTSTVSGNFLPLSGGTVTGNTIFTQNISVTGGTGINWFSGNTSTDLLRVTQTGTGNAFVVEDSTNPDTTPFIINSAGTTNIGSTNVYTDSSNVAAKLQVSNGVFGGSLSGLVSSTTAIIQANTTNLLGLLSPNANTSTLYFGTPSDIYGSIMQWQYTNKILYFGTQSSNGQIRFTTDNGAERVIFDENGNVGIGTLTPTERLNVSGNVLISSNLTASTISATTYQNLPTDIRVTGGTYSAGTISFTNNTGGTFSVTGLTTGSTSNVSGDYLPLSGGTVTGNTSFTSGLTINYIDFDTTPTVPNPTGGTLYYDSTENALSYKPITPSNDVTVNLGQESLIRIYNNSGVQINNGQALHITGATSGSPTVSLAIGTGGDSVQFQISGIATHDIPNSSFGFMTVFGVVRDLNLTGFTVGEQIYLSQTVPGGLSSYSGLSITGRTCEVGHILDNSASGKLQVAILNEIEGTIITTQENNILAANNSSTGVFQFSGLTIDTPSGTTFSVAPVDGWIIDNVTSPTNPTIQLIIYTGSTGNTALYVSSATETYILLTSGLTLTQQTTFPTPQQRRQNLYLGKFGHANRQYLINAFNEPDSSLSPVSQLRDMFTPIRLINEGVIVSANGANLNINTSAGVLYGLGIGYITNKLNPNSLSVSGTSPCTFQYRTQTGGTASNTTLITPGVYDNNGVVTSVGGGSNASTNQRIYLIQNGQFRIQYGQQVYGSLTAAIEASQNEAFTTFSNFRDNATLIGILSVNKNATNLSDTTQARFLLTSKFGETVGAAGGVSTTNLQQAYNNSTTPEITTNSSLGPLSVKNGAGTADNITNVFEGVDSGGTTTSYVRADGFISGSTISTPSFTANTNGVTTTTLSATTYQNLPDNVTGNYLPLSGGTVSGNTVFNSGLTANTISANTLTITNNIDSSNRLLFDSASNYSLDWESRKLTDNTNTSSVEWQTRGLYDSNGGSLSVDWENRNLADINLLASVDWNNRYLLATEGNAAVVWENRQLIKSDGTTVSFDWENGVLTGQTNIRSATISATTYQNLPNSLTGIYLPTSGGTVSGNTIFTSGLTASTTTINGNLTVTGDTNVRAFTGTTGYISGSGQNILTVIGSGNSTTSPLFTVQGSSGELFSVNDSLVGSLFSVNDISGLPILEVFSDNTTLVGSYQAPSLNTTTKVTLTAGTNTVYSIPTSAYTGAFIDYTLVSTGTTGARAGNIMTIWSGTTAQYIETSTNDIGTTTGVTFSVAVSGNNAVLSSSATTTGWTLKTIIRSI